MLRVGIRDAMPRAFPRRLTVAVAAGIALACVILAGPAALARPGAPADRTRSQEWWLSALHIAQAQQSSQGSGMTVAVLGTGVHPSQADLAGSVITGPDYTKSGRLPSSPLWGGEGTAMASLIAGAGHGPGHSEGILGVAPKARILSIRVTLESNDPLLAGSSVAAGLPNAIARGIRYAVAHQATVIDLPLDPVTTPGAAGSGGSPAERAAVAYALRKHVVLVAPGGDIRGGADPVTFPAAYPGVISVGAFDQAFNKTPFSTHRHYVKLTAAGDNVVAADGSSGYAPVNSTDAAAALVTGVAGLVRAQFPRLTPAQVTRALTTTTRFRRAGGRADGSGFGAVDAQAALLAAAKMAEAVPSGGASGAAGAPAPPSPPAVSNDNRNFRATLVKDGAIAGGVFVVLLVLILLLAIRQRRKARAARLAAARRKAKAWPGVPTSVSAEADTDVHSMGRQSAAAAARAFSGASGPATPGPPPPPQDVSWPSGPPWNPAPAWGWQAGASGPEAGLPRPPKMGETGGGPGAETGRQLPARVAPLRQAAPARPARISGTPPWEPAEKPEGDLPWVATPARRPLTSSGPPPSAPRPRPEPPSDSTWDSIAEEAWPGGGPGASRPPGPGIRVGPPGPPAGMPGPPEHPAGFPAGAGPSGPRFGSPPAEPSESQSDGPPASPFDEPPGSPFGGPPGSPFGGSSAPPSGGPPGPSFGGPPGPSFGGPSGPPSGGPPASPYEEPPGSPFGGPPGSPFGGPQAPRFGGRPGAPARGPAAGPGWEPAGESPAMPPFGGPPAPYGRPPAGSYERPSPPLTRGQPPGPAGEPPAGPAGGSASDTGPLPVRKPKIGNRPAGAGPGPARRGPSWGNGLPLPAPLGEDTDAAPRIPPPPEDWPST